MSDSKTESFCPNCGKSFDCGIASNGTCWCFSYPKVIIPDAAKKCLCPACLTIAIEQYSRTTAPDHGNPNS